MESHQQFVEILESKGLIRIGELSDLSGHIGIDTEFWLSSIIPVDRKSEMMGSISMSLRPNIQSEANRLKSLGLTPLFVYPGIPISEKAKLRLSQIWSSNEQEILRSLSESPKKYLEFPYISSELFRFIGCRTFRACYLASAQLAYLLNTGVINCILGTADLLFYGVPKIIIEIMQTRYKYIESKEVFDCLKIGKLELIQAFLLCGYLNQQKCEMPLISILESLKFIRIEYLTDKADQINNLIKCLECSVALSNDSLALFSNGSSDFYGQIQSPEIYKALHKLNLSPLNLQVLSHSKFYEKPPLADSNNYRRLIHSLIEIKSTTASILSALPTAPPLKAPVKVQTWFNDSEDEIQLKQLNFINWKITPDSLKQALLAQKKNFPDLQFCLKWHIDDFDSNKTLISLDSPTEIFTLDCIKSKILFIFLESIGYIFSNGVPTLFGNSYLKVDPEWQHSAFYLQELLKYGMLNGRTLRQSQYLQIPEEEFEKHCVILTDDSSRHAILLISRVFSLVQPTLNEELWTGQVDYDLAQFHSLVYAIFKNYQQLYEAIVMKEYLELAEDFADPAGLVRKSPLLPIPNPALGVAVKRLLILEDVEKVEAEMPHMTDLFLDLQRGWMFWKNFVKIMAVFKQFNAVPDNSFINEISFASKKLKEVLMRARIQVNN